jgi:glycolate oxidase FAD binding subunit
LAGLDRDDSERLVEAVRDAYARNQPLAIVGSGSKSFLMPADDGARLLSVAEHAGVLEYRPDELVVTARAGTPLKDLQQLLSQHRQMLPFEPPLFGGGGTLGGALAAGLSGPGRPWRGSARDALLGVELINGRGERLRFGGKVLKNVAGYDLSRLQVGAFGTLGVLLAASVRVVPAPQAERTCLLDMPAAPALQTVRALCARPVPLTATCFAEGSLRLRFSGSEAAVLSASRDAGGELVDGDRYWQDLRDHRLPVMRPDVPLWRVSLPPGADPALQDGVVEWGGALRWLVAVDPGPGELAAGLGGWAARFGAGYARAVCDALPPPQMKYQRRLKRNFDPENLFNPGLVGTDAD